MTPSKESLVYEIPKHQGVIAQDLFVALKSYGFLNTDLKGMDSETFVQIPLETTISFLKRELEYHKKETELDQRTQLIIKAFEEEYI